MKKLTHPNLLQLYAVCTLEEPIYIVTELMRYGSLLEYMRRGDGRYITTHVKIDMIAQIASGTLCIQEMYGVHAVVGRGHADCPL